VHVNGHYTVVGILLIYS